jgi:hypothetical protein
MLSVVCLASDLGVVVRLSEFAEVQQAAVHTFALSVCRRLATAIGQRASQTFVIS